MEDYLNFLANVTTSIFSKLEGDLNFLGKWKTTSTFSSMEDDIIFLEMEDDLNL